MKESGVSGRISPRNFKEKYYETKDQTTKKDMTFVFVKKTLRKKIFKNINLEKHRDFLIFLPAEEFHNLRIKKKRLF